MTEKAPADAGISQFVDVPALERFVNDHLPGRPGPLTVQRHTAGYSNVTLYVTRGDEKWVLRRPPTGNLLPTAHDVLREHRFISALYGKARVPRPVIACDDTSVIGAPFYLMERVFGTEIRDTIHAVFPLEPDPSSPPNDPARRYRFRDGRGAIGIIASVTEPFCGSCNRIRLTADGKLRSCLFAIEETDLKSPLRAGATDEELGWMIVETVARKWAGHMINAAGFVKPERNMSQIGG